MGDGTESNGVVPAVSVEPVRVEPIEAQPVPAELVEDGADDGLAYATPDHLRVGEDLGRLGKVLIVPMPRALPAVCVRTGERDDLVRRVVGGWLGSPVSYHVRRDLARRREVWIGTSLLASAVAVLVLVATIVLLDNSRAGDASAVLSTTSLSVALAGLYFAWQGGRIVWVRHRDYQRRELHLLGISETFMRAIGVVDPFAHMKL